MYSFPEKANTCALKCTCIEPVLSKHILIIPYVLAKYRLDCIFVLWFSYVHGKSNTAVTATEYMV